MNVWIQRHDFSSEDFGCISQENALEKYREFDWNSEILKEENANAEGRECCSAGMGFVSEDHTILHLVPTITGAHVHYHYTEPKRILGLFNTTKNLTVSVMDFPNEGIDELTSKHYNGNKNIVRELLRKLGNKI